tara:strand:- start:153 stop:659 length:507 start_codon:yes stop_codon:yes gene_type:complete
MAQTNLREYAVVERLNKMTVDFITDTPNIVEATYSDGDLMHENDNVSNAVAVNGGTAILQSLVAVDTSDTGGTIHVVLTDTGSSDMGTVGSAPSMADAAADNSFAIVTLSNWIDVGGAKVCTKTNIGAVIQAASGSKSIRYGIINASGGDIVIGSGEDIILKFGIVKD